MFELMIMRHAKSDWQNNCADIDRPLNDRGYLNAVQMGEYLSKLKLTPDKFLVSSSYRTQQTAQLLLKNLSVPQEQILIDDSLYLASAKTLLDRILQNAIENQRLLILSHNPGVDELVTYLADAPLPLSKNNKLMVTCAVAVFKIDTVDDLNGAGRGSLQQIIRPEDFSKDNN